MGVPIVGIGWATVELERAAEDLTASFVRAGMPKPAWTPEPRTSSRAGAWVTSVVADMGLRRAPAIVLLEPDTEGRLAATLAKLARRRRRLRAPRPTDPPGRIDPRASDGNVRPARQRRVVLYGRHGAARHRPRPSDARGEPRAVTARPAHRANRPAVSASRRCDSDVQAASSTCPGAAAGVGGELQFRVLRLARRGSRPLPRRRWCPGRAQEEPADVAGRVRGPNHSSAPGSPP